MKGVVFNLLEDFLTKNFGMTFWEDVLNEVGQDDEVYVGPQTYEDSKFMQLFQATLSLSKLEANKALLLFGEFCFPLLVAKIPEIIKGFEGPEEFLLHLDDIIHVEVRKILKGAETPKFDVELALDQTVSVYYESERNLPDFAEGLMRGLAQYYQRKLVCHRKEEGQGTRFIVRFE